MIRIYRRAIADADLAIAASGWAVLFWRLIQREKLTRISGLALFKALLETSAEVVKGLRTSLQHYSEHRELAWQPSASR